MTVLVFIVSLLGAMALGMPLAFSLIVSGVALMLHLDNFDTQIVSQNLISGADNFPLMAVPFFMLAGELMNAGGMSRRIVNSAMVWVGHFSRWLCCVLRCNNSLTNQQHTHRYFSPIRLFSPPKYSILRDFNSFVF